MATRRVSAHLAEVTADVGRTPKARNKIMVNGAWDDFAVEIAYLTSRGRFWKAFAGMVTYRSLGAARIARPCVDVCYLLRIDRGPI